MSVGVFAERLSPSVNGVCVLPKMAEKGDMGGNESGFTGKTAREVRQSPTIDGSYRRQSIGQNDRKKVRNALPRASRISNLARSAGEVYGFDGGKKVKGRKRQLIVDSLGLVLKVVVAEGNAGERVLAATALMELIEENPAVVEKIELLWVDSGYSGDKFALAVWLMIQAKVEVIKRKDEGFRVLPKRWIVERTFGWLNHYHRLDKDREKLPEMSEAAINDLQELKETIKEEMTEWLETPERYDDPSIEYLSDVWGF
jgi:putative transposase